MTKWAQSGHKKTRTNQEQNGHKKQAKPKPKSSQKRAYGDGTVMARRWHKSNTKAPQKAYCSVSKSILFYEQMYTNVIHRFASDNARVRIDIHKINREGCGFALLDFNVF